MFFQVNFIFFNDSLWNDFMCFYVHVPSFMLHHCNKIDGCCFQAFEDSSISGVKDSHLNPIGPTGSCEVPISFRLSVRIQYSIRRFRKRHGLVQEIGSPENPPLTQFWPFSKVYTLRLLTPKKSATDLMVLWFLF